MRPILFMTTLLLVTACDAGREEPKDTTVATEAIAVTPMEVTGPATSISVDSDPNLQWAASVAQLHPLEYQGQSTVKLFATAGGDPALNGLYTYIAFFEGPAEGWKVFKVGDFLDYPVVNEWPGRQDLEIEESVLDSATSEISSRKRYIRVGFAMGPDGRAPDMVTVAPAE